MRRPWIKIETCTPDKPEICSIATQLRMDEDTVMGKLVRLWSWAELNRIQPNDIGVTKEFIDKLVGRKGFAAALAQTGWLMETEGKLQFRNFKRHNSPVAQNKALTAKRVARHRLRKSAAEEKETVKPLTESPTDAPSYLEAPRPKRNGQKSKPAKEDVTPESLHIPAVSVPEIDQTTDIIDQEKAVINQDSTLITNDESHFTVEIQTEEPGLPDPEPISAVEEPKPLPEITPEEALAALQLEEPAPRKRRSKAADLDDQPMLF